MYLATVERPRRKLVEFLAGFLAVNVGAGLLIILGPGQLLLDIVPKPRPPAKHIIELVAGVLLLALAIGLWRGRRALGRRTPPTFGGGKRTGVLLGAGIAAVELPSALPYYAAIAVIVGSGVAVVGQVVMLLIFNLAFMAPVIAILCAMLILGEDAKAPLARVNRWILAHWPGVLAAIASALGVTVLVLGAFGLLG